MKVKSKIILKKEDRNANEIDYLIKGRNPLLLIYFVNPINKSNPTDDEEELFEDKLRLKDIERVKRENEFQKNQKAKEQPYLVGFQIGFPQDDSASGESHFYTTNINADYYKLQSNSNEEED